MRTAILLASMNICLMMSRIATGQGITIPPLPDGVSQFTSGIFLMFIFMDIVDFVRSKK